MDKADRAQLLRQRLKSLGGCAPIPKATRRGQAATRRPFLNFIHLAIEQHSHEMPKKWVYSPDPASKAHLTPITSRTERKSALGRIADRWEERKLAERLSRR